MNKPVKTIIKVFLVVFSLASCNQLYEIERGAVPASVVRQTQNTATSVQSPNIQISNFRYSMNPDKIKPENKAYWGGEFVHAKPVTFAFDTDADIDTIIVKAERKERRLVYNATIKNPSIKKSEGYVSFDYKTIFDGEWTLNITAEKDGEKSNTLAVNLSIKYADEDSAEITTPTEEDKSNPNAGNTASGNTQTSGNGAGSNSGNTQTSNGGNSGNAGNKNTESGNSGNAGNNTGGGNSAGGTATTPVKTESFWLAGVTPEFGFSQEYNGKTYSIYMYKGKETGKAALFFIEAKSINSVDMWCGHYFVEGAPVPMVTDIKYKFEVFGRLVDDNDSGVVASKFDSWYNKSVKVLYTAEEPVEAVAVIRKKITTKIEILDITVEDPIAKKFLDGNKTLKVSSNKLIPSESPVVYEEFSVGGSTSELIFVQKYGATTYKIIQYNNVDMGEAQTVFIQVKKGDNVTLWYGKAFMLASQGISPTYRYEIYGKVFSKEQMNMFLSANAIMGGSNVYAENFEEWCYKAVTGYIQSETHTGIANINKRISTKVEITGITLDANFAAALLDTHTTIAYETTHSLHDEYTLPGAEPEFIFKKSANGNLYVVLLYRRSESDQRMPVMLYAEIGGVSRLWCGEYELVGTSGINIEHKLQIKGEVNQNGSSTGYTPNTFRSWYKKKATMSYEPVTITGKATVKKRIGYGVSVVGLSLENTIASQLFNGVDYLDAAGSF